MKESDDDNSANANHNQHSAEDQRCPKQQAFKPVQFNSRDPHDDLLHFQDRAEQTLGP
jgi:hypothetical protein